MTGNGLSNKEIRLEIAKTCISNGTGLHEAELWYKFVVDNDSEKK